MFSRDVREKERRGYRRVLERQRRRKTQKRERRKSRGDTSQTRKGRPSGAFASKVQPLPAGASPPNHLTSARPASLPALCSCEPRQEMHYKSEKGVEIEPDVWRRIHAKRTRGQLCLSGFAALSAHDKPRRSRSASRLYMLSMTTSLPQKDDTIHRNAPSTASAAKKPAPRPLFTRPLTFSQPALPGTLLRPHLPRPLRPYTTPPPSSSPARSDAHGRAIT